MTEPSTVKYRLGLDLGTNSIGWAAVRLDDYGVPCGILDLGVRIFPDGRNPRDGSSNAVKRRIPRGMRRRRDRYLKRRAALVEQLTEYGLMPREKGARKTLVGRDPYELRANALVYPLKPNELGRALFHIDQRRGFKSNRKSDGEDEDEAKKTRGQIDELRRRMKASGARTLGQYLARRRKKNKTVRARPESGLYPDRAMYEAEFDEIRKAQSPHQSLNDDQWDSLKHTIFFQRDLKPVDPGWCQLEQDEKRAPRALPIVQEFRILQEVNNLRLRNGFEPERPLNEQERSNVLDRLWSGKDIDLQKPIKSLGLPPGSTFNLASGGRKSVKGDETAVRLMKRKKGKGEKKALTLFGDRWLSLSLDERNEIVRFMLDTDDPEIVRQEAKDEWALDADQAGAIAVASLPDGYGNLSEKAIRKLLPHLERGCVYSDAAKEAGYHHSDFREGQALDRLPYYGEALERDVVGADPQKDPEADGEVERYGRIGNPTVHIGLNQIRRVVNKIIALYGKPDEIVVELARHLKMSLAQKQEYERRQREGGERNKCFTEMLKSAEIAPSADALQRLRLWEEQGPPQARVCPYTGTNLSFEMVVSNKTQVDHILPWSRTLDNSMSNKVVCVAGSNQIKGDRSPFEAFGHNPPGYDYDAILNRVAKWPDNKKWRFNRDAMERFEDERGFLDRQLNETAYLSRTTRRYLAHLYDEKSEGSVRVRVIPGRMTALLRRGWGLEGMLRELKSGETPRKQRDDHRHHAIDAFVVANTTQGLLQRFARAASSALDDTDRLASKAPPPWTGFDRNEVKPFLDRMVVSYKPDHGTSDQSGKTTGQLHNETAYGLIELSEEGRSTVVLRKQLADLKKPDKDLDAVRDPALRHALKQLWDQVKANGGNVPKFAERAGKRGVLVNGRLQRVKRVRLEDKQRVIPIKDNTGKAYKGYLPGGNEFADIWQMRDGRWKMAVVPTFEANQPGFSIEDFRPHDKSGRADPTAKRLMSLRIDDMCALGEGQDRRIVRVRKIDAANKGRVVLDDHNEANVPDRIRRDSRVRRETGIDAGMKEEVFSAEKLRRLAFRKVGVDEIGRVLDPGPRGR